MVELQDNVKTDRRAVTSPLNGLKGGRPTMDVTGCAEQFLQRYTTDDGSYRFCYSNGKWWQHNTDNYWAEVLEEDLRVKVTSFLQQDVARSSKGRISKALVSDVILNIKGLCGLTDSAMPCWLSNGADASDIVCFSNGLLSIEKLINGEKLALQPCTPKYFGTAKVKYAYDPSATCPKWQRYLQTTFDNEDERKTLQMMFGYVLSNKIDKNVGFFLVGNGGDGKSTTAHVLKHLIGDSQTCCLPFSNLGDRFGSYMLTENKLNLVEELPADTDSKKIAEAEKIYKMVTDCATIPVERKFHSPGQAPARAKCVFLANSLPHFVDKTNGLWDRIIILPYNHRFRGTNAETQNLKFELETELSGILNWAIEGARLLASYSRFPMSSLAKSYLDAYRLACNYEASFLHEVVVESKASSCVSKQTLYQYYRRWMEDNGYRPGGKDKLNTAVRAAFPNVIETRERIPSDRVDRKVWMGIKLVA